MLVRTRTSTKLRTTSQQHHFEVSHEIRLKGKYLLVRGTTRHDTTRHDTTQRKRKSKNNYSLVRSITILSIDATVVGIDIL